MNSLVILLIATSAPAADPVRMAPASGAPVPSYTVTESGALQPADESQPHLFPKIHKLLGPKASSANGYSDVPVTSMQMTSSAEPPIAGAVVNPASGTVISSPQAGPVYSTPSPSYSYIDPRTTAAPESSRPRLFGRVRNLFNRKSSSQPSDALPMTTYPTTRIESAPPSVWGGNMAPSGSVPASVPAAITGAPAISHPQPVSAPSQSAPAQKMPAGSPF
jgi:hypothetical protein